jgi:nucleotide-binding universal stress UspA family protein
MTIKVVLVPVTPTEPGESALRAAFALGRRFEAHVVAMHVRADPRNAMPYMGEGMSGIVLQEIMAAAEREAAERAKACRALFDRVSAAEGVRIVEEPGGAGGLTAAWEESLGREDELVARRARLSDLVVMGNHAAQRSVSVGMTLEAVLLDSGRPLLIVPPGGAADFGRPVAVAWNGSVEASRAVAAAMPFLLAAPGVTVVAVGEDDQPAVLAEGLARFLAWHGLRAETKAVPAGAEGVGPTLLAAVRDAGLLVMGAYTHNRFRELVFGGVTRHVLASAGLPVLVAH